MHDEMKGLKALIGSWKSTRRTSVLTGLRASLAKALEKGPLNSKNTAVNMVLSENEILVVHRLEVYID